MEEILQEAGLSKNEAIIYLKLSQIGTTTAYKIAKESKIFKANTYEVLKKLEQKTLVSKKVINKKTIYEATDPSFLIDLLNAKRDKVEKLISPIRAIQQSTETKSIFNTFKGTNSFVNVLYQMLEYNEPIFVYGAPKIAYELMKHRIGNFHKKRINKKIKMSHIYNFKAIERMKQLKKMSHTPVRYLPELFDSNVSTNICGKEVVFVIWNPPIKIIQIKDEDMAEAYKKYFKLLWKNAEKA